jgi:hypothetical protein
MDYIYLAASIPAAIHAYTFAKVLRKKGNIRGALYIIAMAVGAMSLSVYRIVTAP